MKVITLDPDAFGFYTLLPGSHIVHQDMNGNKRIFVVRTPVIVDLDDGAEAVEVSEDELVPK